jgi:DNA-binding protein WhiA
LKLNGGLELTGSTQMMLYVNTENAGIARKTFKLFKQLFDIPVTVIIEGKKRFKTSKIYVVKAHLDREHIEVLKRLGIMDANHNLVAGVAPKVIKSKCCKRAYLRGGFLARGSVNRPGGNYHLEMVIPTFELAAAIQKVADSLGIDFRITERKHAAVLYLKEAERIVDFLRLIGASYALLEFENVRIYKSMKNQINRQVNCETANLEKTLNASLRQTEVIKKLIDKIGVNGLPEQFRELALLRLEYPDSSLKELGEMMSPPMSKSGIAYRMKKLERMAAFIG